MDLSEVFATLDDLDAEEFDRILEMAFAENDVMLRPIVQYQFLIYAVVIAALLSAASVGTIYRYFGRLYEEVLELKAINIKSGGWSDEWRERELSDPAKRRLIIANENAILRQWLRDKEKKFSFEDFVSTAFLDEKPEKGGRLKDYFGKNAEENYKRLRIVKGEDVHDEKA